MSLSFANQLLSIIFLSKNYHNMEDKIYAVPPEIDLSVANYALDTMNIKFDTMTYAQHIYFDKWK
jgi:adenosylhomocysteinase